MAGLTGTNISTSYTSLLRVDDNTNGVDATLADITDGEGNATPLDISTTKFRVYPSGNANDTFNVTNSSNSSVFVVDTSNTRVGVGNAGGPTTTLDIELASATPQVRIGRGDASTSNTLGELYFGNSTDTLMAGIAGFEDGATDSAGLKFNVEATTAGIATAMTIKSTGKIGIGTDDPDGLLEIASATSNRPIVYITNTSTTADDLGGNLIFRKSDGALASNTHLTDDDVMGDITFQACDSSDDAWTSSVNIRGKIDGTPTTNQVPGQLVFSTNSGSTSVTDRMWIKADGKVGIGAETPGAELEVRGPTGSGFDSAGELRLSTAETSIGSGDLLGLVSFSAPVESDGTDSILPAAAIGCIANAAFDADQNEGELTFYTAGSETALASGQERMRITYDGKVGIGENAPDNRFHVTLADGSDNTFVAKFENQDADNPQGIALVHSGVDLSSDNTADHTYLQCSDSNSGVFSIYGDGDWDTEDGSEQASDRRIKKNIADVSSKLEDVLKLKVRNFNKCMPDGSDLASTKLGRKRVGFIADELMEVFPGLVQSKPAKWMGTDYTDLKRVRMSPLIPILVKAIQELSAKVTALESA